MHLRLDEVSVRIDGRSLVSGVSFDAPAGTFIGLVGPNGSGKSTLLRTVYRAVPPSTGAVLVGGDDLVRDLSAREGARRVAALAQEHPVGFDLTVAELVTAGRTPHLGAWSRLAATDRRLIAEILTVVGLRDHATRPLATLSGGEKQRALLARALVQQPRVLVLDEPTNHLDIGTQLQLLTLVGSLGITVLAALHDLNLAAAYCDRLHLLHHGSVVATGTPEQVLTSERIAEVFAVHAHLGRHPVTGRLHLSFAALPTHHSPPSRP